MGNVEIMGEFSTFVQLTITERSLELLQSSVFNCVYQLIFKDD